MAKKTKAETLAGFLARKVKDYAEYRSVMMPRNSDHDINKIKFHPARLRHNEVLTWN
jgi:hypothetical protein